MGSFTPLVFSTFGGMGGAATTVYKRVRCFILISLTSRSNIPSDAGGGGKSSRGRGDGGELYAHSNYTWCLDGPN